MGAGPPCQDVSKLNFERTGSQRGLRSSLYKEVPRVVGLLKRQFSWAQVHMFMESVASMDEVDRVAMSEDVATGRCSGRIARSATPIALVYMGVVRRRGLRCGGGKHYSVWKAVQPVHLSAELDPKDFLEAGWYLPPGHK